MAPHSSTPAWGIPWTEEPGGLQSMGSRRVGHDWATELNWYMFVYVLCYALPLSCVWLCNTMDLSLPGSSVHGESPGKNTGVGCHVLLQGIFPTQGSNPSLLYKYTHIYIHIYTYTYIYIYIVVKNPSANAGDMILDRGASWGTVHGVAKELNTTYGLNRATGEDQRMPCRAKSGN